MEKIVRQIAHIVHINDILNKSYVEKEGWEPNYIVSDWNEHISRVNIIATVVEKSDSQLLIDDATGTITVRSFEEISPLANANVGQTILCVGKIRKYADEYYIIAEIIKPIDSEFMNIRKQLLVKWQSFRQNQTKHLDALEDKEPIQLQTNEPLLDKIEELDDGQGVQISAIIEQLGQAIQPQINTLLMQGDIFEIRPNVVKVLK